MSYAFTHAFREAAPYINYLRGKTLVIGIASTLLNDQTIHSICSDFKLLASLGIKLVLVHGSSEPIQQLAKQQQHNITHHHHHRVTDETTLNYAKQACGALHFELSAALSSGIAGSLQKNCRLHISSGNYFSARPFGVIDGIDMGYTGRVRKVDSQALQNALQHQDIILISPLASSLSGQLFSLSMSDVAQSIAIAIHAEKLIFLVPEDGVLHQNGTLHHTLTTQEAHHLIGEGSILASQHTLLHAACHAVEQGVNRCQIISGNNDGALLEELFTQKGSGTSIAKTPFIHIRSAQTNDIADIMALTQPLEQAGILLKRSQDYFAEHIEQFYVLEHDRHIHGCVALKHYPNHHSAELACLVVAPNTQDSGYGEQLLAHILQQCKQHHIKQLFALTTHTSDWFCERGFRPAQLHELPPERQQAYQQSKRQSKIFKMELNQPS